MVSRKAVPAYGAKGYELRALKFQCRVLDPSRGSDRNVKNQSAAKSISMLIKTRGPWGLRERAGSEGTGEKTQVVGNISKEIKQ